MNTEKVLIGVLSGLVAGFIAGLLFAPGKGSRLLNEISKKGEEYAGVLEKQLEELINSMNKEFETAEKEPEAVAQDWEVKIEEFERVPQI